MFTKSSKALVAWGIFATCFISYVLFLSGHHYSIDGMVMFQYAKALWFNHSLKIAPAIRWGAFEHAVPQWSIGLSLAYIPLLALLSKTIFLGNSLIHTIPDPASLSYSHDLLYDPPYQYCSVLNPAITAISAVMVYLLGIELGLTNKRAAAAALTFGLFSPATVYSKLDFAQPMASLFLLLNFFFLVKGEKTRGVWHLIAAGICIGLAILTRSEFMIIAPTFAASVFFMPPRPALRTRRPTGPLTQSLTFGLAVSAMVLLNQAINFLKFGSWLSAGYPLSYYLVFDPQHWLTAFVGNLVSPGRGILFFFPASILSVVGIKKMMKTHRWFAGTALTFLAWALLFYPIWRTWDGGICWGPRYLIPTVPYLCLFGYLALPVALNFYYKSVVGLLVGIGAIATLQGMLFGFDFYGSLRLSSEQWQEGLYHFSPVMSPLVGGWKELLHPATYDIKWFHLDPSTNVKIIFPVIGTFCLILLLRSWFHFFLPSVTKVRSFNMPDTSNSSSK